MPTPTSPETYHLPPKPHIPSSPLPVLIYRSVLPFPITAKSTREYIEANRWMQGGSFGTYTKCHYHSVTHECYAVFRGESEILLGRMPGVDDVKGDESDAGKGEGEGVIVRLGVGDCIVLPVSSDYTLFSTASMCCRISRELHRITCLTSVFLGRRKPLLHQFRRRLSVFGSLSRGTFWPFRS